MLGTICMNHPVIWRGPTAIIWPCDRLAGRRRWRPGAPCGRDHAPHLSMTCRQKLNRVRSFFKILWWQGIRPPYRASVLDPVDRHVEAKPQSNQTIPGDLRRGRRPLRHEADSAGQGRSHHQGAQPKSSGGEILGPRRRPVMGAGSPPAAPSVPNPRHSLRNANQAWRPLPLVPPLPSLADWSIFFGYWGGRGCCRTWTRG